MKPGKPATFGVIQDCLMFALPGNPVSSFVTANLFLPLALLTMLENNRFFELDQKWPRSIKAQLYPTQLKADKYRPEYHRCIVYKVGDNYHAVSTGAN
jgi:molybdopterin biosynthesis enzyme